MLEWRVWGIVCGSLGEVQLAQFSRTILVAIIGPCGRCVREWRVGFRGLILWLVAAGFRVT